MWVLLFLSLILLLRELYTKLSFKDSLASYKITATNEARSRADLLQRDIKEGQKTLKSLQESLPQKDRRIIQMLTQINHTTAEIASLRSLLASVEKEARTLDARLAQVAALARTAASSAQHAALCAAEKTGLHLQSEVDTALQRLEKYSINNQKIIKAVNETTIKNFELNKECEDTLYATLKEIEQENRRLEGIAVGLVHQLEHQKLSIYRILADLGSYRDSVLKKNVTGFKLQAEYLQEKMELVGLELRECAGEDVRESVDQKKFVLESLAYEMKSGNAK